jgi:cytochrome c oxidase subunit 1
MAIYFTVIVYTYLKGQRVGRDPWDGRTLEWSIPNPPPEYNFAVTPTVHARDAFWYEKHHQDEIAQEKAEHAKAEASHGGIHMPHQSVYPLVASAGMLVLAFGACYHSLPTAVGGVVLLLIGVYLWSLEGADGYHLHLDADGHPVEDHHASH